MKKLLLTLFIAVGSLFTFAHEAITPNYLVEFKKAYQLNPDIPKGLLEAVAFTNTRVRHINPELTAQSCTGMPKAMGVFGYMQDGKSWFRENIYTVSTLSGISVKNIKSDPYYSILAYANAFTAVRNQLGITSKKPQDNLAVLVELSELPLSTDIQNDFVLNSFLYITLRVMEDPNFQSAYNTPYYQFDYASIFGSKNSKVLCATQVNIEDGSISSSDGTVYEAYAGAAKSNCVMPTGPIEYPSAIWNEAYSGNYGAAISPYTVAIHTVQGSYSGCVSWFKNSSSGVSTQYVARSYDGQITQMVCHKRKAYHVASQNAYAVGIEHEGYIEAGSVWYSTALYNSSSNLVKYICGEELINTLECYDGPPTDGLLTLSHTCTKIKGHQHFTGNSHTDPGPMWDWERYYRLLNPIPTPLVNSTASSGTMYDSGGASGNYGDEERNVWIINPTGNSPFTLTFSSWSVENGYDYLTIYEGTDNTGTLIGKYSGTSPGTITSSTGAVFLEFRSDCATNNSGWRLDWATTTTTCDAPVSLTTTSISAFMATINWGAVAGATSYNVRYKSTLDASWTSTTTTSTSLNLTGLRCNAVYNWEVEAVCAGGDSGYNGTSFTTLAPGSTQTSTAAYTSTECSGKFYDSGSNYGNYSNYESWTYTIQPTGATSVSVVFTAFDTEANYDKLYVYDGASVNAPLLGTYSGTSSPGTINSSGGSLTFKFTSDTWTNKTGFAATWSCVGSTPTSNPETSVDPINNWITDDFMATYTDVDNNGNGLQYRFYQVLDYDGTDWTANRDNGFLNDNFENALDANWVSSVGTWAINAAHLQQSDETGTNTNLYIPLAQGNETYLYHWSMKISGAGTNRRAGLHFYCDDPSQTQRGNSYMVYFRVDQDKTQIYESVANSITLYTDDNTTVDADVWYDYKIIYNSSTGNIKVFQNDVLVSQWTDSSPLTSANSFSLRTGECSVEYDDIKVYKTRGSSTLITAGTAADELRYENPSPSVYAGRIKSIIIDDSDNWSDAATGNLNVDFTAPSTFAVRDGNSADIDLSFNNTELVANWDASTDSNSDIAAYYYKVGTTPGGNDVIALTNNGTNTIVNATGLNLAYNVTYYFTVVSQNGAGLFSAENYSDGIIIQEACSDRPETQINNIPTWATADFSVDYINTDLCAYGIENEFVLIADNDGSEYRSNDANGYFLDKFEEAIHPDWNSVSGNWSIDFGRIKQDDEANGNSNIYASLTQNNSLEYLYEWDMVLYGSGGNRRAGLHFFCDDATLTNRGNSYFVWYRADDNKMQIYEVTNDVFSLKTDVAIEVDPGVIYNNKVIYDPSIGVISVYRNDEFVGSYTDATPLTSGNAISLRTGNSLTMFDNVKVFHTRANPQTITVGGVSDDIRFENPADTIPAGYLLTVIKDNNDKFSYPVEAFVNVDLTAPEVVSVSDGLTADVDETSSSTTLSANWTSATENQSEVDTYWYSIGTSAGATDLLTWTNNGLSTNFTNYSLNLTCGETYYVNVKTTNTAGLESSVYSSDGITTILENAPIVSNDTSYCENEVLNNISATPSYGGSISWYSDASLSNLIAASNSTLPSLVLGTEDYFAVENVGACSSPASQVNVTINELPSVSGSVIVDVSSCNENDGGIQIIASGGSGSYSYSINGGFSFTANGGNFTGLGVGSYSMMIDDGICQSETEAATIMGPGVPDAPVLSVDATYCDGETINPFTATAAGTVTWYEDAALTVLVETGSSFTPTAFVGSKTFYAIQEVSGCFSPSSSVDISVYPIPVADFSAVDNTLELPTSTTDFVNTSIDAVAYEWNFGDGSAISTDANPTHDYPNEVGVYSVTLTAFGANCPSDVIVLSNYISVVDTSTLPVAQFSFTDSVFCAGESLMLTNTSTDAYSYQWLFPGANVTSSTATNGTATYTSSGLYEVTLIAYGSLHNDTITKNINIIVEQYPVADFTADQTTVYLPGATVNFTSLSSYATSFSWVFGDGTTSTDQNPTHTYSDNGFYTVVLIAANDLCSNNAIAFSNYINVIDTTPAPLANFNLPTSNLCVGSSATLMNTSLHADSYLWSFPAGVTPSTSTAINPEVIFPSNGNYTIQLTAYSGLGFSTKYLTVTVAFVQKPVANFSATPTEMYISNSTAFFTNSSTNATGYQWYFGDGNGSTDSNPWNNYQDTGMYDVMLIASNDYCPSDTMEMLDYIHILDDLLPVPSAEYELNQSIFCVGQSTQLTNLSQDADAYKWFIPGATPSFSTDFEPVVTFPSSGSYAITLVALNDDFSDTITYSFEIEIMQSSIAQFEVSDSIVVEGNAVVGFVNNSVNASQYTWHFGDGQSSNDISPWHVYSDTGYYSVQLIVSNGYCLNDTITQDSVIRVMAKPNYVSELQNSFGASVYPNPSFGNSSLELTGEWAEQVRIQLYNAIGQSVKNEIWNTSRGKQIPLNNEEMNLSPGVYSLSVSDKNHSTTLKLVIR